MLDARDASQSLPFGQVNHWVDVRSRATSRIDSFGNGSQPESPQSAKAGLRSRKPGSRRRVSTADGSLSSHPLQSPTLDSSSSTLDGAVTRPSLRRRLDSDDFDEIEPVSFDEEVFREAEVMVIVHEVTRTDSIASVALKYGVTLADLRKANHLWASDSIHMRKVLYIPLHLSSRKDLYYIANGGDRVSDGDDSSEASCSSRSSVLIQRIPTSQLAFFPPPSQSSLSQHSDRIGYPITSSPPRIHIDLSGPRSLSSLLQSIPLPSRDSFFPRLSTDSNETSSAANPSETSSDQEHEMDVLGQIRARDRTLSGPRSSNRHRNSGTSIETLRKDKTLDPFAVPLHPLHVPLQTEQLKPSPQMELPRSLKRVEE